MVEQKSKINNKKAIASGILIGIGIAGFLDTIIFHEILQWHHMVSNVVRPDTVDLIKFNILMDGVFLAFTLAVTVAGLALLWGFLNVSRNAFSTRSFAGLVIFGFGLFNTADGILNHLIFAIHHFRDGPDPLFGDLAFLAIGGFLFMGIGALLIKQGDKTIISKVK